MELVNHPLVSGPANRAGLFWFTIAPLFTDPIEGSTVPRYLSQPELVLDPVWAFETHTGASCRRCLRAPHAALGAANADWREGTIKNCRLQADC